MTDTQEHTFAPWTAEETAGFTQVLVTFGDGLPGDQRQAFATILAMANDRAGAGSTPGSEDAQGYFYSFFFDALRSAAAAVTPRTDLSKAMEGQKLYIPR